MNLTPENKKQLEILLEECYQARKAEEGYADFHQDFSAETCRQYAVLIKNRIIELLKEKK